MLKIQLKILDKRISEKMTLPHYETLMSAGMDLRAMPSNDFILNPNEVKLVPTGIAIYIANPDVTALIVPRSGLGYKHGIVLSNLTGVIDADYQGQLMIPLWNHSQTPFTINVGDRIAQMLFVPVLHPVFDVVDEFNKPSIRGIKGFGSTGNK